jgi:hypothetical protein
MSKPSGALGKTIFIPLILLTSPAIASDPSPTPAADVSLPDLSYLPSEGQLIGDSTYSYEKYANKLVGNYKYGLISNTFSQSLQYGITNDIAIGLSGSYSTLNEKYKFYNYFGDFSTSDRNYDFGNPILTLVYRGLHQSDSPDLPINVDASFGYSPNLIKAWDNRTSPASGGSATDVNVSINHVFQGFTILGQAGATLYGRQKLDDPDGSSPLIFTSHTQYYLDLFAQYRPTDELFVTVGGKYFKTSLYREKLYDPFYGDIIVNNKIGNTYSPSIGASYQIIKNLIYTSLTYEHSFIGNTSQDVQNAFFNYSQKSTNGAADSISFGVRFLLY